MATLTHTSVYVNFESLPQTPGNLQEHNSLLQDNVSGTLAQTGDPLGMLIIGTLALVMLGVILFSIGLSLRCKEALPPGITEKRNKMACQHLNKVLSAGIIILLICFTSLFLHSNAWATEKPVVSSRGIVEQNMPHSGVFRITYLPYGDDISSRPLNRKLVTVIPNLAERDASLFIEATANGALRIKSLSTNQYLDAPLNPAGSAEAHIEYNRVHKDQTGQWIFTWNDKLKAWRIHNSAWGPEGYLHTIGGGSSGFDYYCLLNQSNKTQPEDSYLWRLTEILLSGTATITGELKPGSTLTCTANVTSYKPGKKGYRWYVSDDPNKKGLLVSDIPPGTPNTSTLAIPESYAGHFITCEVYSDTYRGEIISNTVHIQSPTFNAESHIKGSYEYGSKDGLQCEVTGLPDDFIPEYTWFRGDKSGSLDTEIGKGKTHVIDKDDVGSYISCRVTDNSGKHSQVFIAEGSKAFARISITAPLLIEGSVTGNGTFAIPPLSVTNESLCDVSIYEIGMTQTCSSALSATVSVQDTILFKGTYGGRITVPNMVLTPHETLPFELNLKGSLSNSDEQRITQHGSFNLGSLTFCARL